jgi:peptidylprolyl isomerase
MNKALRLILLLLAAAALVSCSFSGKGDDTLVLLKTSMGDMKLRLYNSTPVHRDNFLKLVDMGFYNGVSFHRVISHFMIQAGDPATRTGLTKEQLDTLATYTIPAEFDPQHFHKRGALAAAREGNDVNPEMRSSGTQFYIVQGIQLSDEELNSVEAKINGNIKQALFSRLIFETADSAKRSGAPLQEGQVQELASLKMFDYMSSHPEFRLTDEQRTVYKTIGGVPRLDQTYTVFGEVTEGLEVIDKIASVPTDQSDKPLADVRIIKMKVINR